MSEALFPISKLMEAFFETARSRRQMVNTVQKLYRYADGSEIPDEVAVAMVEAYYAQNDGGKPWLRKETA